MLYDPEPGADADLVAELEAQFEAELDAGFGAELELEGSDEAERRTALPLRMEAWRRRTVTGALLTGVARGLGQVFETEREQPAIVAEAPGEPFGPPRPVEAVLDPDDPAASTLLIRRWLLDEEEGRSPG